MRVLVGCSACQHQFDVSDLPVGSKLRCVCGETIRVPELRVADAAVVRCSACGAPRSEVAASACAHCNADFTVHEQELGTVCPACSTRISNRARFCHHCATAILPDAGPVVTGDRSCPSCEGRPALATRQIGTPALPLLECSHCAGIWVGENALERLLERARDTAQTTEGLLVDQADPAPTTDTTLTGWRYRNCPVCDQMMNRRNYGGESGIIIDSCRGHGIWFDTLELDRALGWVRKGGERRAEQRAAEQDRARKRQKTAFIEPPSSTHPQESLTMTLIEPFISFLIRTLMTR